MNSIRRKRRALSNELLRAAVMAAPAAALLNALLGVQVGAVHASTLSWDQVGGGALGGTGTWDVGNTWWDGGADVAWTDGNDAVFAGTAGIVTISGVVAPSSMTFQTTGYRVEGGLVNNMPSITLNSGVTATFASATGTNGFGTTFSLGSGSELVFAPPAVGTAYTYAGMLSGSGTFHVNSKKVTLTSDLTTATTTFSGTLTADSSNSYIDLVGHLNSLVSFGGPSAGGGVRVNSDNSALSNGFTVASGGVLAAGVNNAFGDGSATNIISANGATLRGNNGVTIPQKVTFAAGGLTTSGWSGAAAPAGGGTGAGDIVTFSGIITDNGAGGAFTKTNVPDVDPYNGGIPGNVFTTVVLTNPANSWTGATNITGGMLVVGASGALPSSTVLFMGVGGGKQLYIPAGVTQQVGQFTSTPSNSGGFVTLNGTLKAGDSGNFFNANAIFGSGTFEKTGSGTMTFNSGNFPSDPSGSSVGSWSGGTFIFSGGTVNIDPKSHSDPEFGAQNTIMIMNGGTLYVPTGDLDYNPAGSSTARNYTVTSNGGTFDPSTRTVNINKLTSQTPGTGTVNIICRTEFAGSETKGLGITTDSPGFSGPVNISGATVRLTTNNGLGDASATNTITLNTSPVGSAHRSVLNLLSSNMSVPQNISIPTGASGVIQGNDGGGSLSTLAGIISGGGSLTKPASGRDRSTLVLSNNNNSFTGPITILGRGVLSVRTSTNLGSAGPNNNVTLDAGGSIITTDPTLPLAGPPLASSRTITVGNTVANGGGSFTPGGGYNTNGFDSSWGELIGSAAGTTAAPDKFTKIGLGKVTFHGINTANRPLTLQIDAGTLALAPNGGNSGIGVMNTLAIAGLTDAWTSQLDVNDNDVILHSTAANRQIDTDRITNQLKSGLNATTNSNQALFWSGQGIVTSSGWKGGSNYTGIGVTYNDKAAAGLPAGPLYTSFDGQTVGVNDVLVKYTWFGDADLDGSVTSNDYFQIDTGFLANRTGWINGDFDYNGVINSNDYFLIDSAFLAQGGTVLSPAAASTPLGGVTAVPEPAMLSIFSLATSLTFLRRRRRSSSC